jgi:hypothetical protein
MLVGSNGLIKLEMISGGLPRNEFVRNELDNRLSDGVPKKLRLGECTLLYMSMDCLLVEEEECAYYFLLLDAYRTVKLKHKCLKSLSGNLT